MKRFTSLCKDSKTGYEMILSECTFNQAAAYLDSFIQIKDIFDKEGLTVMTTNGKGIFYYDEPRGYLLFNIGAC